MKIQNSFITMNSRHDSIKKETKKESYKYWEADENDDFKQPSALDKLEISDIGKKKSIENKVNKTDDEYMEFKLSEKDKQKIALLEIFMEKITGKKFKFNVLDKVKIRRGNIEENALKNKSGKAWGFEYNYSETHEEMEMMSFNSKGAVKTEDGRSIDFDLSLNMSRSVSSSLNINMKAGELIDPLVINFDSNVPSLSEKKFSFDLDSDGKEDNISFISKGSGFLALDKNEDGTINNGKELFGPNTGDGFSELAKYDMDNNGWIDENDDIYDKLRIWTKDENGNDKLFALGQKGIGAIYLGNIDTEFSYKNAENETMGQMRTSSVFLKENGDVGVINQIDLSV